MKRILCLCLALALSLTLTGCSEEQTPATVPEIEFITLDGFQCPQLKTENADDSMIQVVNEEIKRQFSAFLPRYDDGSVWETVTDVHTFVSSTDTMISVMVKQDLEVSYGLDEPVWGICYDYKTKMIVPSFQTCLSELGYPYDGISENVADLLDQESLFEYIDIEDYVYFDSNSEPVLVVNALEHPWGAEKWLRIFYYSPVENAFIDSPWNTLT